MWRIPEQYQPWILTLVLCLALTTFYVLRRKTSLPYPPGPKRLPLIGNLLDMPKTNDWETYARWGQELNSDIIYLDVAGSRIVVLNSLSAAQDLLDKRSAKYSSRARFVMSNELVGWGWLTGVMTYGRQWRARRRLFQKHFDPSNPSLYLDWQIRYGKQMLESILDHPERIWEHMQRMNSGSILAVTYGIEIKSMDDPYVKLAVEGSQSLVNTLVPGKYLVDSLPFLKDLPDWFPGTGFKQEAKSHRAITRRFREEPFNATVDALDRGVAQPSFVSRCLQGLSDEANQEELREAVIDIAGNIYLGGADTTLSGVATFLLAMMCHPEVQKKVQEELDSVFGHGRLPELEDKEKLPYLEAVLMEVLRWKPATPIGIPHCSTEDDIYNGYFIPKNTVVVGNGWAILHDEIMYPEPEKFIPERFLTKDGKIDPSVQHPSVAAFGFGRRECPGKHVAMASTWIFAAYILSAFNLEKPVDPVTGKVIEPSMLYHSSLVYTPVPFKIKATPRSDKTVQMIRFLEV